MSIAVFLSGTGTNFDAIYNEQSRIEKSRSGNYGRVDVVFTNVPGCPGAMKAEKRQIPVVSLSSRSFFGYIDKDPSDKAYREFYDAAAMTLIDEICKPDIIVLAGYRRKLSGLFHRYYKNRIINMYPGDILADYPEIGTPAYISALESGETELRCSAYIEREDQRFGSLIAYSDPLSLAELSGLKREDAEQVIREKAEWKLFPHVVHKLIARGKVYVDENHNVFVEGEK